MSLIKTFKSFIMSIAIILFSLPHFVLNDYTVPDYYASSNETESLETSSATSHSTWVIYLVIMTFISSVGCMPLYTTGTWVSCRPKLKFN